MVNGLVHANPNPYAAANGAGGMNGGYENGHGAVGTTNVVHEPPKPGVMNAKAGTGNIRPRPVKKQRMVCFVSPAGFFWLLLVSDYCSFWRAGHTRSG